MTDVDRIKMLLAEAGYPHAYVIAASEGSPLVCDGISCGPHHTCRQQLPPQVINKAFSVLRGHPVVTVQSPNVDPAAWPASFVVHES